MKRNAETTKQTDMGILMALILLCIFAICVTLTIMYGARIYEKITAENSTVAEDRIAVQFIKTKIREQDESDLIKVADFDDISLWSRNEEDLLANISSEMTGDTLFLYSEEKDPMNPEVKHCYCTRIYCFEGYLRELYTEVSSDSADLKKSDGEKILEAKDFSLEMKDNTLYISLETGENSKQNIVLTLQSEGGALNEK